MVLIQRISIVAICLATLSLGAGYAAAGAWTMLPVFAFLGGLWLSLRPRDWGWVHSLAMLVYAGLGAFGLLARVPAAWMLIGLMAALSAWDLEYFLRRVRSIEQEDTARMLARQHLRRLAAVVGLGLLLAGAALAVRARFSLAVGLVVGLLAILALSQVIGFLRRESD